MKVNHIPNMKERKLPSQWKIECAQGMRLIFEQTTPINHITQNQIVLLIQTLISKYALTPEEILQTHLRKNTQGFRQYIHINRKHD